MVAMTARSPRKPRRRVAPAAALPRPAAGDGPAVAPEAARAAAALHRTTAAREHHVEKDYSYVRKDLLLVAAVGTITAGFIIGMSFVL